MEIIIPLELCELEERTYHPLVEAQFNGKHTGWWVIDSGASKSVFDISLAEYYQLDEHPAKQATGLGKDLVKTVSGYISELWLGGTNLGVISMVLIDLSHINEEYARFSDRKIVGLLGADFLMRHRAVIDFEHWQLKLRMPGKED